MGGCSTTESVDAAKSVSIAYHCLKETLQLISVSEINVSSLRLLDRPSYYVPIRSGYVPMRSVPLNTMACVTESVFLYVPIRSTP